MPPPPPRLLLLAVGLISGAALAYEILLMRLFSIIQWHHFAYMVISLALLGYGASGTFLTVFRGALTARFSSVFATNATLFGVTSVTGFLLAQNVPFNALEILWDVRQWGRLIALYGLLTVPFFLAANCLGLCLQHYREHLGRVYSADLIGGGTGALAIVLLLFAVFPLSALLVIGLIGIGAALLSRLALQGDARRGAVTATLAGSFILVLIPFGGATLRPVEYKALSQTLRVMGARPIQELSSPLGFITVVENPAVPFRHAPGLSIQSRAELPEQLAIFVDGDGPSVIHRYTGNRADLAFLADLPSALPYHLLPPKTRVLILGAGGGGDVLQALAHDAGKVDAVEVNPQMIRLVRRDYGEFAGHPYDHPAVRLHLADARGFVAATESRYHLIQLALLDGFAAASSGLHALNESYLYTVEALRDYLTRLEPGGYLAITRWVRLPPRDGVKLFATAVAALKRLGSADPGQRLAWIRSWQTGTLLVKNGDLTREDLARIRRFSDQRAFDLAYLPGLSATESNRHNILSEPYFFAAATALLGSDAERFMSRYKFAVEPATDDRPYFFQFFRWPLLAEAWSLRGSGGWSLLDFGYPVLVATLIQSVALSALLILAPLGWLKDSPTEPRLPGAWRRTAWYFGCIGLAFMFTEIVYLQKFILYLAHPLYAIPVVLAAFLWFAGLGARRAARVSVRCAPGRIALATITVTVISLLYLALLPGLFAATLQLETGFRVLIVIACIAPLAFCMGMPFPLGLARSARGGAALVPWAFGINGCASVIAAILAALLAMHFGQTAVLLMALSLYLLAARFSP